MQTKRHFEQTNIFNKIIMLKYDFVFNFLGRRRNTKAIATKFNNTLIFLN